MKYLFALFLFFFSSESLLFAQKKRLIDKDATPETKALYKNLRKLSKNYTLFGHQHATEYGHGWEGEPDRSDVKSVTGSHPAVIGIDFGGFTNSNSAFAENYKQKV